MTVIVGSENIDDCMADVIRVDGGAGNPKLPTLFQVADLDSGVIRWSARPCDTHHPKCLAPDGGGGTSVDVRV